MSEAQELRARAAKARKLGRSIDDERAREALAGLARELEVKAAEIELREASQDGQSLSSDRDMP